MADEYGTIVFSKTEDASFDNTKLLNVLNNYFGDWEGDGEFYFEGDTQYPSILPTEDGESIDELKDIGALFKDVLQKGSITLACASNMKARYIKWSSLTIDSIGNVKYVGCFAPSGEAPQFVTEEYTKKASK